MKNVLQAIASSIVLPSGDGILWLQVQASDSSQNWRETLKPLFAAQTFEKNNIHLL